MDEKIKDLMEETRIALSERLKQIENTSYEERIGFDWRGHLSSLWEAVRTNFDANCPETLTELFLTQVWKISRLNVGELRLDGESKQVNVIVDNDDELFFSNNTANLGCPVIGDTRHGFGKASINRLCLHATSLAFKHPNGKMMKVESPIPRQLISELKRRLG